MAKAKKMGKGSAKAHGVKAHGVKAPRVSGDSPERLTLDQRDDEAAVGMKYVPKKGK